MNSTIRDQAIFNTYISKLKLLLEELNSAKDLETVEDLFSRYSNIFKIISDEGLSPTLKELTLRQGDLANSTDLNSILNSLSFDINILFKETVLLNQLFSRSFNQISIEEMAAKKRIKKVRSLLGDYKLFASGLHDKHSYFSESFVNTDNIDLDSSYLINSQAYINESEGIVTLGFNKEDIKLHRFTEVVINSGNGSPGNNFELDRMVNDNLGMIVDNNPDTWFEYEKVVEEEDDKGLILSLVLKLAEPSIVNRIVIYPNNFGTENWLQIESLDISFDGKTFVSIKEQIPQASFVIESDSDPFYLGRQGTKYEGIGSFTFHPRTIQFIKIKFVQLNPYPIVTSDGERLRYAIGIRGIEAYGIKYLEKSEAVSKTIALDNPIAKVALATNQFPRNSNDALRIMYELSPDDGTSWYTIDPLDSIVGYPSQGGTEIIGASEFQSIAGQENELKTKILNFNNGDEQAIETGEDVDQIRWRIKLERNDQAFANIYRPFSQVLGREYERFAGSSYTIKSRNRPTNVCLHISVANQATRTKIGTIPLTGINNFVKIPLPIIIDTGKSDAYKMFIENFLIIKLDEDVWTLAPNNQFINGTSKHFRLEESEGRYHLIFGDGTWDAGATEYTDANYLHNKRYGGMAPESGASIYLLTWETPDATVLGRKPLKIGLPFPSDMDPNYLAILNSGSNFLNSDSLNNIALTLGTTRFDLPISKQVEGKEGWIENFLSNFLYESELNLSANGGILSILPPNFIYDRLKKYTFAVRQYINGSSEFMVGSYNIHDPLVVLNPYAPLSPYLEQRANGNTVENSISNPNITLDYLHLSSGQNTIFYSIRQGNSNDGVRNLTIYFSKPLPSDCETRILNLNSLVGLMDPKKVRPSLEQDEIGSAVFIDDSSYVPSTKIISAPDLISGDFSFITFEDVFEPGSLIVPSSLAPYVTKEVKFINGSDEFKIVGVDTTGLYSINYERAILHFPKTLSIQFTHSDVFQYRYLELTCKFGFGYSFGEKYKFAGMPTFRIEPTGIDSWQITPSRTILQLFSQFQLPISCSWDKIVEDPSPIEALVPYYSPIVKDLAFVSSAVYDPQIPNVPLPPPEPCTATIVTEAIFSFETPDNGKVGKYATIKVTGSGVEDVTKVTIFVVEHMGETHSYEITPTYSDGQLVIETPSHEDYQQESWSIQFTDKCGGISEIFPLNPPLSQISAVALG